MMPKLAAFIYAPSIVSAINVLLNTLKRGFQPSLSAIISDMLVLPILSLQHLVCKQQKKQAFTFGLVTGLFLAG